MKMDWVYLAGFFDGEGCITYGTGATRGPSVSICLVQSKEIGLTLFKEISEFLRDQQIVSQINKMGRYKAHHSECHSLRITSRRSVMLFLVKILPYLRIKR